MKALIAMSGGVDSSVAAKILMDAGYECIGCTMRLLPEDAESPDGSSGDAEKVARELGIPFYTFDFRDLFRACVIDRFIDCYANGRTPNPCIECNRHLKFAGLLQKAEQLGCDYIATGHYARIEQDPESGEYLLKKGLDEAKDQSYVLYNLTQEQMAHVLLPLGGMHKEQVRRIAAESGLVSADRPDSQDICFVPGGDYAAVIRRYAGRDFPKGEFTDLEGNVIGTHKGIIHYTIGQHKRLGQAFGRPRYVCRIDAARNRIALGGPDDVFSETALADDVNWIRGAVPEEEVRCRVRTRYKQKEQWARVVTDPSPGKRNTVQIIFDEPQRAVTPGQAAVFYDGDAVLGGGTIL